MEETKAIIPNEIRGVSYSYDGSNGSVFKNYSMFLLTVSSNYMFDASDPLICPLFGIWIIDYSNRLNKSTTLRIVSTKSSSINWQQSITPTEDHNIGIVLINSSSIIFKLL